MTSEVLHVCVVLEEGLWVPHSEGEEILFIKVLVEGAEGFVFFSSLLCHDGWVDETVDIGGNFIITSEVAQTVYQLCVCVCGCV